MASEVNFSQEIDTLQRQLRSSKATQKKEGLKHLNSVLDSEDFLHLLDQRTLAIRATDRITVASWPGLCALLVEYASSEVSASAGKKRGPDAAIPKTLKRLVQLAEDDRRSGRRGLLARKAAKLFTHMKDVIQQTSLASPLGQEYSAVLRNSLLTVPQYCDAAGSVVFQELLDIYMGRLEQQLDRSEDTFRNISTLLLMLQHFPGDMEPVFQRDVALFFTTQVPELDKLREDSRICLAFVSALNAFMLQHGLDVASMSSGLQRVVYPFMVRCWGTTRDAKLKDAFVLLLRIQIQLGAAQESSIGDTSLLERMERDILQHSFSWGTDNKHGDFIMTTQAESMLQAVAALHGLKATKPQQQDISPDIASHRSSKRQRVESPLLQLHNKAVAAPLLWAPVMATCLRDYPHAVPESAFADLLHAMHLQSFADIPVQGELLWMFRYYQALAVDWPTALTSVKQSMHIAGSSPSTDDKQWKAVWDNVLTWLATTISKQPVTECALALLATVAFKQLTPTPLLRTEKFWGMQALQQHPNTEAMVALIYIAFSEGERASFGQANTLHKHLLQRLLTTAATAARPANVTAATLALMGNMTTNFIMPDFSWTTELAGVDPAAAQLKMLTTGRDWAVQQASKATEAFQHSCAARKAAAEQPWTAGSPECSQSAQQQAGQLLHQDLQLLTVDTEYTEAILLTKLLKSCSVTAQLIHALATSAEGVPQQHNTWCFESAVREALVLALKRVASLLVQLSRSNKPLLETDHTLLRDLVCSIHELQLRNPSASAEEYAMAVLECVQPVEEVYSNADQVAMTSLISSVPQPSQAIAASPQATQAAKAAAVSMFDDDLDMGTTAVTSASTRPSSAGAASAGVATACCLNCLSILTTLGQLKPDPIGDILASLLQQSLNAATVPPQELVHQLVHSLCTLVALPEGYKCIRPAIAALAGEGNSLLASGRYERSNLLFVLQELANLAKAYQAQHGSNTKKGDPEALLEDLNGLMTVLEEALKITVAADQSTDQRGTSWRVRVQSVKAILVLITVDTQVFGDQLLKECLAIVANLLSDNVYAARHEAGKVITTLYHTWTKPQSVFDDLKQQLSLYSLAESNRLDSEEHMETAVLMLGVTAAASQALEREAVFLLCGHAAKHPSAIPLVKATLSMLAAQLHYPSLPALMAQHAPTFVFDWWGNGYSLDQFQGVQDLVAINDNGLRDQTSLFKPYVSTMLPMLLLDQSEEQIEALAGILGTKLDLLLLNNMEHIIGAALPYQETGDPQDKTLAATVLTGGILAKHVSGEECNKHFARKMVLVLGDMLLMAATDDASVAKPYFETRLVLAAIYRAQGPEHTRHQDILWKQVLKGDGVAQLLLICHQHLQLAHHPRHVCQALAPLRALLELLGARVTVPSTFRYVTNILLQHLTNKEQVPDCCRLLTRVFRKMLSETDTLATLGQQLQHILSSLTASLQVMTISDRAPVPSRPCSGLDSAGTNAAEDAIVKLILQLTSQAPAPLHAYLRDAEPLLPFPALEAACRLQRDLRQGLSLATELLHFAAQAKSMSAVLKHRSLTSLIAALPTRKQQLYQQTPDGQGYIATFLPEVEAATWHLLWLSAESHDRAMAALTGELLALAGAWDPAAIALKPLCFAHARQPVAVQPSDGSITPGHGSAYINMITAGLRLMADYLVDIDVLVIKSAQFTLRHLLATAAGKEAFDQLDPMTKGYLQVQLSDTQVYHKESPGKYQPSRKDASDPKWDIQQNNQLWALEGQTYDTWISKLAHALLMLVQDATLSICQHMVFRKAALAELMLPHILADIAQHDTDQKLMFTISTQLRTALLRPNAEPHVKAMKLILTCLDHLHNIRLTAVLGINSGMPRAAPLGTPSQSRSKARTSGHGTDPDSPLLWQSAYWLDLDYLSVAKAAMQCSAPFTALLYTEHWIERQHGRLVCSDMLTSNKACSTELEELLLDIYSNINEPDSIYAVASGHSMVSQLKLYEHEGSWDKALAGYDMLCRQQPSPAAQQPIQKAVYGQLHGQWQQGLLTSLQHLGCRHVLGSYWQHGQAEIAGSQWSKDMMAESAWRMGQWQQFSETEPSATDSLGTNEAICGCLKAISSGDIEMCRSQLFAARSNVVQQLAMLCSESASHINPAVLQLQQLQCLQDAWEYRHPQLRLHPADQAQASSSDAMDLHVGAAELQKLWHSRDTAIGAGDIYELRERLLALERAAWQALALPSPAADALHEVSIAARKAGHLTQAMAAAHELSSPPTLPAATNRTGEVGPRLSIGFDRQLEQAKLQWAQGHQAVAVRFANSLLEGAKAGQGVTGYAQMLSLTGKWLAETRFESSSVILGRMAEAVDVLVTNGKDTGRVACRVMYRLAHHADTLYQGIVAQKQSSEWNTSQAVIKQKRQQVSLLQEQLQGRKQRGEVKKNAAGEVTDRESRLLLYQINSMMRPINFDEEESNTLQDSQARFLLLCITNYRRCLLAGDKYDLQVVFRLFQLWFTLGADRDVNAQMAEAFRDTPSYKMLSLVYQGASRLSAAKSGPHHDSGFQATLQALLKRLAIDHPFHTLYHLFALKNGNRGKDGREVQAGDVYGGMSISVDRDKVAAASRLLRAVATDASRKAIVEQVNSLIEAYITLAALPASADGAPMPFPGSIRRSSRGLNMVPVVSAPVAVDSTGAYDALPHFTHFGDTISFVGGINKPKLIQCFDSTGACHRQLVKSGNDDMRQDAVMQQFFELVNSVLQQNPDTHKRKLRIATYKVVPFSPASGLLEWVEDTIPVHEYLTGKDKQSGAQKRYSKSGNLSFSQCFQAIHKAKRTQLRPTFDHVLAHFPPVLHHFFLETFRQPAHWFERRLQYTRSVAVNSIAGYIIGLGDRHSHNILLDRKTAEVVHIDLGVAFEQGRFLNTPELVPFRLTSNIVDGMGATGVEGVMRSCCEHTLGVLRQNKESLLTIIEVFIHDPLYKWALTPLGAQKRQKDDSAGDSNPAEVPQAASVGMSAGTSGSTDSSLANADAERALLRLKQKLAGVDGGQAESRGIKGQVQQLLQDAQDPDKLCKMYVGWSAWL